MAVEDTISPGVGFGPGSVQYIVTRGLGGSLAVPSIPGQTSHSSVSYAATASTGATKIVGFGIQPTKQGTWRTG